MRHVLLYWLAMERSAPTECRYFTMSRRPSKHAARRGVELILVLQKIWFFIE